MFTEKNIKKLIQFDQIMHNWGRIIGDIGHRYILTKADDSHTNFTWNQSTKQLEGRTFTTPKATLYIAFNIEKNAFVFINSNTLENEAIIEVSQAYFHIIKHIQNVLVNFGIAQTNCPNVVEFRFSQHFDEDGYTPNTDNNIKTLWMHLRSNANSILQNVNTELNKQSEIRIWPTNFNTSIYYKHPKGTEQWAGFSSADNDVKNVPYFYNCMKNSGNFVKTNNAPKLINGYWENKQWHGAVLPMDAYPSIDAFLNKAQQFIIESTKLLLTKA